MARRVLDTSSAATAYLTKDNIEHPPTVSADITAAEVTARAELLLDLGATAPATNMTYLKLQHPGNLDAAPVPRARQRVLVTTCAEAAYLTKDNIEYPVPTFDAAALAKEAAARDIISIDVGAPAGSFSVAGTAIKRQSGVA